MHFLKVLNDGTRQSFLGKDFHNWGATMEKALSPVTPKLESLGDETQKKMIKGHAEKTVLQVAWTESI